MATFNMVDLRLLIQKLKLFKKNNYLDLLNNHYDRTNLLFSLKTNLIVKDYLKNISKKTSHYSISQRYYISKKAFPLLALYETLNIETSAIIVGQKNISLEKYFWNPECLDATLIVLKVILKNYKKEMDKHLMDLIA